MLRKLTIISAACLLGFSANAQKEISDFDKLKAKTAEKNNIDTVAWIYNGNLSLGLNEGFLHNWAAGGEIASMTVNGLFNGSLIRYNNKKVWTNNLDLAYGLFYAYSNSFIPRKTDDRIDFTSKYGYRLKDKSNWYLTGLLNAKTQFTKAYDYEAQSWDTFSTSKFLSPLYLTLAPGIEYRKGSQLSLFFSPLAGRAIFVDKYYTNRHPEGAFGVENGKNLKIELGAYFTGRYQVNITKDIIYNTRLDLYSNYLAKDQVDNGVLIKKDNPGNIDILWDNNFTFKFYKYFSINLGIAAIYDNDVPYQKNTINAQGNEVPKDEPLSGLGWWQIKQVISVGFNYKF